MTPTNGIINNDNAINSNTVFETAYCNSRRIPVILHRREIGKVFAEVNDDLIVIAGEDKKEHEYLILKSKVSYFDEKQHLSINGNSLKDFEI
jgi:hypothetical protein